MGRTMARAEEETVATEEEDSITVKEQLIVLWEPSIPVTL